MLVVDGEEAVEVHAPNEIDDFAGVGEVAVHVVAPDLV